jgi:hypothetical protein
MKPVIIPVTALVIFLCVVASGCTSNSETTPAATTVPATIFTSPPTTAVVSVTASPVVTANEPVQLMPSAQQVNLLLTKDRPTSELHLLYQGGPGEIFTQKIVMQVYTSNTTYQEFVMSGGEKPIPNDEIVAPGTRGGDRCVVFVYSAGTRYKVMDEKVYSPL